jgi:hypothetical protein
MANLKSSIFAISLVIHVLSAVAVILLFMATRSMAGFCVISGALIACAGAAAQRGQPVSLYIAFGMFMGYAFWLAVSAINQRAFIEVLPAALLAAGAAWLLQDPRWASVLFTGITALLCLALAGLAYNHRFEIDFDPERIRLSALTTLGVLTIALVYLALGFAEASLRKTRKKTAKKTATIRTPSGPPSY